MKNVVLGNEKIMEVKKENVRLKNKNKGKNNAVRKERKQRKSREVKGEKILSRK